MWLEFVILCIVGGIYFYRWATKNNDFFEKRNIPYEKPTFFFGGSLDIILRRKTVFQLLCDVYNKHDGIIYGTFDNRDPIFLLRDPDLIKHVMIKDFDHFVNRKFFVEEGDDHLFSNSLLLMQNDRWRDMRNTLSPAFTGSKMRQMFQLMLEVVHEAMTHLKTVEKGTNIQQGFEMDVKDFTTRLTNDVIASTAFGVQINSFRDKENAFYTKARKATKFTGFQQVKMLFIMMLPKVAKLFKMDIFDKDFTDYFMSLVLDAMKYRKENNIRRPDMINLLMEARGMLPSDAPKTHFREWSDMEMVAQCLIFYIAGFEPSSGIMSFAAHELMEHPDVQNKLYDEIEEFNELLNGAPVTYDVLKKMPYMDMVVSEVLRKWPIALVTDRTCTKDFVYISPKTGERIEIKEGEFVRVSMCGIQRDPKYFENPDVLDPERFNAENKTKIDSGTYMPFGLGPRNCIGNRFALLELKAFLYYLLRDYRLEASAKTKIPLEIDAASIQLQPKHGFWLQFIPRK